MTSSVGMPAGLMGEGSVPGGGSCGATVGGASVGGVDGGVDGGGEVGDEVGGWAGEAGEDGGAVMNPGIEGKAAGSTKVTLTNKTTGDVVTFTVNVS
jgi:hypothetical protein